VSGFKRIVRRAKPGRAGSRHHGRNHHIGRQLRTQLLLLASHDRAAARHDVDIGIGPGRIAGKANLVAVRVADVAVLRPMMQAANDGPLVHDLGTLGKQFADLNAGHRGGDGRKVAADFRGRIGLRVPHIVLTRAAAHPKYDHRLAIRRRLRSCDRSGFAAEDIRERKTRIP
jgi:hypothetical protein